MPAEGADVTMLSAKSYHGLARSGVYSSIGYSQPVTDYLSTAGRVAGTSPLAPYFLELNTLFGGTDNRVTFGGSPPWDQMSVFVVLFRGVSASATIESVVVESYEILPATQSAWLSSLTPGACPDLQAMELVYRVRHSMPDAFDSSKNFLGALAGLLGKFLPGIITHVGGAATSGIVNLIKRKQAARAAKKQAKPMGVGVPTQIPASFAQALGIASFAGKKRKKSAAARKRQRARRAARRRGELTTKLPPGFGLNSLMQALSLASQP
jgi:hypothetical protein